MTASFEKLCTQAKAAAYVLLEGWEAEPDEDTDIVDVVLANALAATLPKVDEINGDWVMQMMWEVPDLMADTEYSDGMEVNETTWNAVHFKIGNTVRDDVRERAAEIGLVSGGHRI
ncbi:MAG: hypothetical protein ACOH2L_15995 [Devosia sp.]